jgi:hypothetical protein
MPYWVVIVSINWVLANTTIDINSTNSVGWTPIWCALFKGRWDGGLLLVEKGANLFIKSDAGESAMDRSLGPYVLRHAKNYSNELRWSSVKPLLLLSKACAIATDDDSLSPVQPLPSVAKVFGISGIVRDYIAPYLMRNDIITRDPEDKDEDKEPEPDEVKLRIEAALAAACSSSSSSNSSSKKRAREELSLELDSEFQYTEEEVGRRRKSSKSTMLGGCFGGRH